MQRSTMSGSDAAGGGVPAVVISGYGGAGEGELSWVTPSVN